MLVTLALTALASFAGAVILAWSQPLPPAAHIHLALAVGVMPLILGAMSHFVPVLTRSSAPAASVLLIPWLALAAGALTVFSFIAPNPAYYFAALLALAAATAFAGWIVRRARLALGKPHPCLYWYLAAIVCLMLALAAVAAMALWPEQRLALKRLHLHLNTLGFIGLTAIATLQVLLPTAVGRPDPQAATRLLQDLKWALGGTLLIAVGAAWLAPLAWLGALLWALRYCGWVGPGSRSFALKSGRYTAPRPRSLRPWPDFSPPCCSGFCTRLAYSSPAIAPMPSSSPSCSRW
ncbi:MAG: hypothetical protein ACYCTW_01705 [Sulfuricella sp.]